MNDSQKHISDPVPRAVAIVGLLGVGLIHLLDSIGKYSEVRYVFWMYIALILGTIVVSGALLHRESRVTWAATGLLAASALVGFIVNRTVGLPNAMDDIGNWTEPLGLASLFVEGCLVALAGYKLILAPSPERAPRTSERRSGSDFAPRRLGVTD
ncbi:MAG: hypothetical protein QOC95_245 [Thermoleophilaceae bacterium]|jgi:hypothetical protein|nr:hypothetical protein [Thermoleophilaceae bacterium]